MYDNESFIFTNNEGAEKILTRLGYYVFIDTLKGEREMRLFKEQQGL